MKNIKHWIEAMRLRTLPVSVAGVITAIAAAMHDNCLNLAPAVICLIFAVLAQIASNFANEYFDYAEGRDRPGREGPRRGVTEGEISPAAMKRATWITLAVACMVGLTLVAWGGWWLIAAGVGVALGVFAYSAGPYPLSTHGWGEAGVVLFFGIVPVNLTYYIQCGQWSVAVAAASLAIGLMGANVLIVNNYRDCEDDAAVSKNTLCVRWGRKAMLWLYGLNSISAAVCLQPLFGHEGGGWIAAAYVAVSILIIRTMSKREGAALTPLLGMTAMAMFAVSVALLALSF